MKSDGDVVEIHEAFDLTGSLRDAAELAGCAPNTVGRYVRLRARGRPLEVPIRRNQLADPYLAKVEEWVERSTGKVRADVVRNQPHATGVSPGRRPTMNWHAFRRVVVVLAVAAVLGGCSPASGGIESSSLASTSAEPSAPSPGAPFPSTIEGRDVLNGEAAISQMRASPTDWYLVGGWVRIVMVDGYSYSGTNVLFFPTDPEGASATAATAVRLEGPDVLQLPQSRPMVLEVQLDLSCTVEQGPCPFLMVKRVVWT